MYFIGVCTYYAGFWAPLCIFFVSVVVLYLYRSIYTTVVAALPYNGGAYTVLLTTTRRPLAILAGFLTFLSYVSTAVVSATVAVSYVSHIFPWASDDFYPVFILWIFAVLNFMGLRDSAAVAVAIFLFHLSVLALLILDCTASVLISGADLFWQNFNNRYSHENG